MLGHSFLIAYIFFTGAILIFTMNLHFEKLNKRLDKFEKNKQTDIKK